MFRAFVAIIVCLATLPGFCQSNPKYQVGTITAVERNRNGDNAPADHPSYAVSIQVDRTIYVVRYQPELGLNTVEYAPGRELLVLVGDKSITCNDLLGRAREVPIISQKPAAPPEPRK